MEVVIGNAGYTFAQVGNGQGFVANQKAYMKLAVIVTYSGREYNAVDLTSGHVRRFALDDEVEPRDLKVVEKSA